MSKKKAAKKLANLAGRSTAKKAKAAKPHGIRRIPAQSSARVAAPKPRQARFAETQDPANERLEGLAEKVLDEQDTLTTQTVVVEDARKALIAEMVEQERVTYSHQGLTITCTKKAAKYSLRVRKEEADDVTEKPKREPKTKEAPEPADAEEQGDGASDEVTQS